MKRPPNIVVIMADQLAPHFTGAYGHPLVRTPHMEALAARGTRFDAAYCNAPLCAPSRFSFMSGQLVTRIAAYDNGAEQLASIPTFAHDLRALGYRTCLAGKMHFVGPDQLHGFDERLTTDVYPADFAWTPDWEAPDERIDKWYHNMDSVRDAGRAATTYQIEYDEETAHVARRRIFEFAMGREAARRGMGDMGGGDGEQAAMMPFMMVASFIHPHDPYLARPEWWDLYDSDAIDMPRTGPADDPHTRRIMRGIEADKVAVTQRQIRDARHAYYANTSYFDSKVGVIVGALREAGLLDETVVMVTSDHGDMLGERGLWYKMNFFEHSARVPLIVAGPGVRRGRVAAPVSLVDLYPTFVEIAGGEGDKSARLDGRSLWPLVTGEGDEDKSGDTSPERAVFAEYTAECVGHPLFMIRRGRWKYIHCAIDPPQLFDVEADPFERTNLADDPAQAERAAAFRAEAEARWDPERIRLDVIATQRRRRAVHAAMERGERVSWDYQPPGNAADAYVRNHVDWEVAVVTKRWPPPAEG